MNDDRRIIRRPMNEMSSITARLDSETRSLVRDAADARGISDEDFASEAIRRVAEQEADYRDFVQVGIDAIERGDVVPHEQVMAELDEMIAKHRRRCGE